MTLGIDRATLVAGMLAASAEASAVIRRVRDAAGGTPGAALKPDGSPVTVADEAADALIRERLAALAPGLLVVSEENAKSHGLTAGDAFILVDPIDGTKEFMAGRPEFTVNIALVEHGVPTLGVVEAPATGDVFWVDAAGRPWCRRNGVAVTIAARTAPAQGLTVAVSRSHRSAETDQYLATLAVKEEIVSGSSLKFCLVAEGAADVSPRLGPTHEWDTAAGDAVVRAAGGSVRTLDGALLTYGKPGFKNPDYVVWGRPGP